MKKISVVILVIMLVFSLCACSENPANSGNSNGENSGGSGSAAGNIGDMVESDKVLVAYFSCSGNTQTVAEQIGAYIGGSVYQITPQQPYTTEDLNYSNESSRTNVEDSNDAARPEISGEVENMNGYEIVFLGYPIWYGKAPKIIYTFLESYDFSGKTIVPFCTAGSSPIGSSATNLHLFASTANWMGGTRFLRNASTSQINQWVDGLWFDFTDESN